MVLLALWRIGLLFFALLACGRAPGSDDQCESDGTCSAAILNGGVEIPRTKIVTSAIIANDNMRAHLSYLKPGRVRSEMIRSKSTISDVAVLPLSEDSVALIVHSYDGKVAWYRGNSKAVGSRTPLQSMGGLDTSSVSCLAASNGKTLALGHQDGSASLWEFTDGKWLSRAKMASSHHDWEQVTSIAVSRDGSVAIVCTGDNIGVWRVDGSATKELKHLHGGAYQVSAVYVHDLEEGGHLVIAAFHSGSFQGWEVPPDSDKIEVLWDLPRNGKPRITAITVGGPGVVAADADGGISFWPLDPESLEIESNQSPRWNVKPAGSFNAVSLAWVRASKSFDPDESEQVAVAIGSAVVILDGDTGWEVSRNTEPGSPVALCTQ